MIKKFLYQRLISQIKLFKNLWQFFKIAILLGLGFSFLHATAKPQKVVQDIDYLYLYSGLPMAYKLPEEFSRQNLVFSGNYTRYTKAKHRKDRNDILFTPITPTKVGKSAIMVIRNKKNEILTRISLSIQRDNLHKIAAELRDLLVSVDGIEVKIYNNKVYIDGQVLLPIEMARINRVIGDYGRKVKSLVTFSPIAQKKMAELIESEIEYPEVQVKYAYNRFLLEGCVATKDEKRRAIDIASLYTQYEINPVKGQRRSTGDLVTDRITYPCESSKKEEEEQDKGQPVEKLIQVVVHFVEMNKSFNKGFLFQWSPAVGDQGTQISASLGGPQPGITGVLTATIANFFPKLNWAKRFSFARVLHNSSILIENTKKGTMVADTQVPDQVTQSGNIITGGRKAGLNITVTPIIMGPRENMIQLNTDITVSSPADVGVTNRTISTIINVRDRSSAVIGGLTSSFLIRKYNDSPEGTEGTPILNLHASKTYNTKNTQFIVFITPVIKSSASVGVDRIKKKFRIDD